MKYKVNKIIINDNNDTITNNYNETIMLINYFIYNKNISEIFIIPLIYYILLFLFILHVSIFNKISKKSINYNLSNKKRNLIFFLILFLIYNLYFYFHYRNLSDSETTIFPSIYCGLNIFILFLILIINEERNKKIIKLPKNNPILNYLIINCIYLILEIIFEIKTLIFYHKITFIVFSFFINIYLLYLFYKFPDNTYETLINQSNIPLIELNNNSNKFINVKSKKSNHYITMNIIKNSDSQNILNQIITKKDLPNIKIFFKNSFHIDYSNNNDKNIAQFYTNIYFQFKVIITSSLFIKNNIVNRTLEDFIQLDNEIHSKKCNYKFPKLKINKIILNNNLDSFEITKNKVQKFLFDLINEPLFINKEVLNFIGINDIEIIKKYQSYQNYLKYNNEKKNNLNEIQINENSNEIINNEKIEIKIIEGNYSYSESNLNKKYYLTMRLTNINYFKLIKKYILDIIFLIIEISKINNNFHNQIKPLINQFLKIKLEIKDKFIPYYKVNDCNNQNNKFEIFIETMEKILQFILDNHNNYEETIFNEFFSDCFFNYKIEDNLNNNKIINIYAIAKNYIIYFIQYKNYIFYEINLKILLDNENFIEKKKFYKFKEIKRYIDILNIELNINLNWPNECFINNINNNQLKYKKRLYFIGIFLNKIFNHQKFFKSNFYLNIFNIDKIYTNYLIKNKKNSNSSNSISFDEELYNNLLS